MSLAVLANELTSLTSEAKRKHPEVRNASEKSLQELRALPVTSEQQLAADLSRRAGFVDPFILACETHNVKLASSGVACLQRLIVSRGLARARLSDALEAFNACTNLGLDVQLKILQALPSLFQNYADDLKSDLLSSALQVCSSLQNAKVQTVSGVASATLQQLVTSVFEKVTSEDRQSTEIPPEHEISGDNGPMSLRPAAFDAYRLFRDLALAAEDRSTKFVQFTSTQKSSLEILWTCIDANTELFATHPELSSVIRSNVLPLVTRSLSERMAFPITIRSLRILNLILSRSADQFSAECEVVLGLAIQALDPDSGPLWKRSMAMELFRDFFTTGSRILDAYSRYDMAPGGKPIVQDLMSAFVRLSAEKPSVIGLGQQSTAPTESKNAGAEQASVEAAGGMAGIISSALGAAESNVTGISSQWSFPRTACLEQLDKVEAPPVPESYIYALVLECLGSLSDGLAKVVLPLTVLQEKTKSQDQDGEQNVNGHSPDARSRSRVSRSHSFRKREVPSNPFEHEHHGMAGRLKAVNAFVECCWPAVLATSSTFLNAALDEQFYRNLIKAHQRFAQVAGLLRLSTARDALVTTLSKAAVPPHVVNAALAESTKSPTTLSIETQRMASNPKVLLSVETLVSPVSSMSGDRDRRASLEPARPMLTARNLLCLRALLNLAIALGPTLDTAFAVVVDTLRQADMVLGSVTSQQTARPGASPLLPKSAESLNSTQTLTNEVSAVEAAASRFLESTADYPNDAFINVLNTFCRLLHVKTSEPDAPSSPKTGSSSPRPSSHSKSRTLSGLPGISTLAEMRLRDYKFVIPKLGSLAELNVSRFASDSPVDTGWNVLVDELVALAASNSLPKEPRRVATSILCKAAAEVIVDVTEEETDTRSTVQRRSLAVLLRLIDGIYAEEGELSSVDLEVQGFVVDALRTILERSGESLVAGWNRTLAIISSVFDSTEGLPDRREDDEISIHWNQVSKDLVAVSLGRTAFAAIELVCSDFLSALPVAVFPSLIELLHRFACQSDDLNISFTSITLLWNVSDFLLGRVPHKELELVSSQVKEADEFEEEVQQLMRNSTPAQWLLLLLRIQDVVNSCRKEVRQAAFQTLCSIFKNNGNQLSPVTWDLTLRSITLRIAFSDVFLYHSEGGQGDKSRTPVSKDETFSAALVGGISEVISQHLRMIEQIRQLPSLWETFLSRLEAYIDLDLHPLNAAVYQALTRVLSQIETGSKTWGGVMYRTLALWLKRNPATVASDSALSSQEAVVAYIEAGTELYRLTQQSMTTSQTRTLVQNLYNSIQNSDGPHHSADVATLSPLQRKAFQLLKSVRTDTPSTLVIVAARLISLHHDTAKEGRSTGRPTFVALASEAIGWTETLVLEHLADADLVETDALINVLQSFRHLIEEKYSFRLEHKSLSLWRRATRSALTLSIPILQQCQQSHVDKATKIELWREYVKIASGIVKAKNLKAVNDKVKIYEDQLADIESFEKLHTVLVPRLGDANLPDDVRITYARALFEASIVHSMESGEIPVPDRSMLENIGKIRRGRVKHVRVSQRERMCYACFSELITLSRNIDGSVEAKRLAQATAPLLILRLAFPIRAYIADQPLRGRRPQPLSELEELLYCFDAIKKLQLEPDALAAEPLAGGRGGERAHLRFLYPLLVKAVAEAGDPWSGAQEVLRPLQGVLEAIAPAL